VHVHAAVEHRPAITAGQRLVGFPALAVRRAVLDAGVEIHVLAAAGGGQSAQVALTARLGEMDIEILP
jgi:hypothetical protein